MYVLYFRAIGNGCLSRVSVLVGQIRTPCNLQNCSYVFSCCFLPFPTKPCEKKKKLFFSVKTKTAPGFEVLAILFRVHRQVLDLYLHVQTANDGHKIGNIQTRVAHLLHEFLHALHPFVLVPGRNLRIKKHWKLKHPKCKNHSMSTKCQSHINGQTVNLGARGMRHDYHCLSSCRG